MIISMKTLISLPLAAVMLTACAEGLQTYAGPNSLIAVNEDRGLDNGYLADGVGAIVYDPDGCQGWLIDDGVEGYSGRRFDPVSGLPVCNNLYPAGTVVGEYRTTNTGFRDRVKGTYRYVDSGGTPADQTRYIHQPNSGY